MLTCKHLLPSSWTLRVRRACALFGVSKPFAHLMASAGPSSDVGAPDGGRVAAAGASGLPSSPVDETALDKLVERALAAHKSGRFAFAAALWGRAVAAATQIIPNTLAVMKCKLEHADSLSAQASATNSLAEKAALREESWALSFSVLPLLSSRMDANTLLPGRCTQTEVEFQKRFEVVKRQVLDEHPWSARDLQLLGFGVGYGAAMLAARHALSRCFRLSRPEASEVRAFVLRVVDMARSLAPALSQQPFTMNPCADASSFAELPGNHIF